MMMGSKSNGEVTRDQAPGAGALVRRAHGRLTRALRTALAEYRLGIGEFQLLRALYSADGLSQSELSDIIEVEKGALTKLFFSMENEGFIKRPRDAKDSRKRNIFLAARGEALRVPLLAVTRSVNRAACRGIPKEDVETMMRVLDQITTNIDDLETSA
jgi:DNA-binding MarR family transcriptional regulator